MDTEIPVKERRYMSDLHFDHEMWTNSLKFYKEELTIFKSRLEEIVGRNTKQECTSLAEHFQNQFIREEEVIDILMHDIKLHEEELVKYAKDHPVAVDHVYFENHTDLIDRMEVFEKLWKELRGEYMNFLRNWM